MLLNNKSVYFFLTLVFTILSFQNLNSQAPQQVKLVFSGSDRKDASKQYIYGSNAKDSSDFHPLYDRYYLKPQYKVLESGPPVFSPGREKFVRYENAGTEWRMIIRNTNDGSLYLNIPPGSTLESCPQWLNDSARIFFQREKVNSVTDFAVIDISDQFLNGYSMGTCHNQYYSITSGQSPAFVSKYDSSIFFTAVVTGPFGTTLPAYYNTEKKTEQALLSPESPCIFNDAQIARAVFSSFREPNSVATNTHISVSPVDKKIAVAGHIRLDITNDKVWDETRMGLFIIDYSENPVRIRQIYSPVKGPYSDWPGSYHFSPDGQKVAFNVDMGLNDFRIYLADAKTGASSELVKGAIYAPYPWSSDAAKLVYYFNKAFWTISASGNDAIQVTLSNLTDTLKIADVQWVDFEINDDNAIQKVEIVDPYPELIINKNLSNDEQDLMEKGRQVSGVTADGISRVLVRAKTIKPGDVTFSIKDFSGLAGNSDEDGGFSYIDLNIPVPEISVTTVEVNNENWAFAVFNAPLDFVRSNFENLDKSAISRKTELKIFNQTSEKKVNLNIHRPPLVFVHGLWSSRACWDDFYPLASPEGSKDNRFTSYFADYSSSNDRAINYNTPKVLNMVREFIDDYRIKKDAAITGADLIVHSMGGLISRAMAVYTNNLYFCDENYGKGYIHKLITMNTPHNGAEICDFLWDAHTSLRSGYQSRLLLEPILYFFGGAASFDGLSRGAVYDMIPGSTTMNMINLPSNVKSEAPCHRFACDASAASKGIFDPLFLAVQLGLFKLPLGLSGVYGTYRHDLCVTIESQRGSAPDFTPSSQTLREFYTHFSLMWLNSALGRASNHPNMVIDLLNAKRNNSLFSENGRNVYKNEPDEPLEVIYSKKEDVNVADNYLNILQGDSLVKISSPSQGSEVQAGNSITVTVEHVYGSSFKKVWLSSMGYLDVDSIPPYTFNMPTYTSMPSGKLKLFAFAQDNDGNTYYDKSGNLLITESYININSNEEIIGFTAGEPKIANIRSIGEKRSIRAMGLTKDSVWIELISDKNTTVSSTNPSVCQYLNGFLVPKTSGMAQIIISYKNFKDTIIANVDLSYQHPDANAGGDKYIKPGTEVSLDASKSLFQSGSNITYTWALLSKPSGSNAVINGINSQLASIIADMEGSYSVSLTIEDDLGNISSDMTNIFSSKPAGITKETDNYDINLKIKGRKLEITNYFKNEEVTGLILYDLLGYSACVISVLQSGNENVTTVSLEEYKLSNGIYLCRIITDKGNYVKKIILLE